MQSSSWVISSGAEWGSVRKASAIRVRILLYGAYPKILSRAGRGPAPLRDLGINEMGRLYVVVEGEFVRVRAKANRVGLGAALIGDEGLDQFFAEHVTFQ